MNYPSLQQNDFKWANVRFSKANLTIKSKGCAIVGLTMLAQFYGEDTDPEKLSKQLRFTPDGDVYWKSFTKIFKDIKYVRAYKWADTSADLKIIDDLLVEWPLLVETRIGWRRKQMHWVVIWKKEDGRYLMSDPLTDAVDFQRKYGNLSNWIYGIRLYKKKIIKSIKFKEFMQIFFKDPQFSTVYQLGTDNFYHAFINEKLFVSLYGEFSSKKIEIKLIDIPKEKIGFPLAGLLQ